MKLEQAELRRLNAVVQNRKEDAHEKIRLGGLITKTGLRKVDKALILGLLIELRHDLETGKLDKLSERYKALVETGNKEFPLPPRPDLEPPA